MNLFYDSFEAKVNEHCNSDVFFIEKKIFENMCIRYLLFEKQFQKKRIVRIVSDISV
jgi:hypothetical protein